MLNQCQFIGNLGRDPEVRSFANGGKVCNLSIGTSQKWTDKNSGEKKERTTWVPVAIFNDGLVRIAEQYLSKGSKVYVQGQFEVRKWQNQEGNDQYSTEIVMRGYDSKLVMLDGKSGGGQSQGDSKRDQRPPSGGGYDDEIPF